MPLLKPQEFDLPTDIPVYIGRQDFVVAYAAGKSILHLGCVDAAFSQKKFDEGLFLHARMNNVAKTCWGVDVDGAGLDWMRSQGWQHLYHLDIENLEAEAELLAQPFALLVLTEVLEHLNNPGRFLDALKPLFRSHTELLLTTPNSTSLGNLLANLHHREAVHPDHVCWYSYHTLESLFNKHGFKIKQAALYSQYDYTRPWIGKFLPKPARVILPEEPVIQPSQNALVSAGKTNRGLNLGGWLHANTQAAFYGCVLRKWPFFADGLIAIIQPAD
jgi:2-polyprenyl-3-methyl-5-hydroxy-6-metoxy-1,4-benzoquinol methylase